MRLFRCEIWRSGDGDGNGYGEGERGEREKPIIGL